MLRYEEYGELPPFASATNKALDVVVREKETKIRKILTELDDTTSRSDALRLHMRNVGNQVQQIQHLLEARNREIKTERHLKEVAKRETGRLTVEVKNIEKHTCEFMEQTTVVQNSIYRTSEKIANVRSSIQCEAKELDDWLKIQREKEEDNMIILKYSKEDNQRINELTMQIERQLGTVLKRRSELSHYMTEGKVTQLEVERASEEFRALHQERQHLLEQWERALENVRNTDVKIASQTDDFQSTKRKMNELQGVLNEQRKLLDVQEKLRTNTENSIQSLDKHVAKLRGDNLASLAALTTFSDEVDAIRKQIQRSNADIKSKKEEINDMQRQLEKSHEILSKKLNICASLEKQIKNTELDTKTKDEKAQALQDYLREEEVRIKILDKEIKSVKENCFRANQALQKLQQDETTTQAEIVGANAAIRNLTARIAKIDQESVHQRTLIYNQEFALQQAERKLKRAQGERTDEEKTELTKRIEELTTKLEAATQGHNQLVIQLRRSQDDLRHAKKRHEALERVQSEISEQIDGLNLYSASAGHQLSVKIKEKEELMVEESILRLEVRKLRGLFSTRTDNVYSLEARQIQLQLGLEERAGEIEMHKNMLRMQIRTAEDERSKVNEELREKLTKIDRMKTRYEILMTQISAAGVCAGGPRVSGVLRRLKNGAYADNDDAGGDGGLLDSFATGPPEESGNGMMSAEKSQAYYIIRAAQQREALLRQGDGLDNRIRKAEREIRALENTRAELNSRNEKFREALERAGVDPDLAAHRDHLRNQLNKGQDKLERSRAAVREAQVALTNDESTLIQISAEENQAQHFCSTLSAQLAELARQLKEVHVRRERAWYTVKPGPSNQRIQPKVTSNGAGANDNFGNSGIRLRPVQGNSAASHDMRLREAREVIAGLVWRLEDMITRCSSNGVKLASQFRELLANAGIEIPKLIDSTSNAPMAGLRPSSSSKSASSRATINDSRASLNRFSGRYTPTSSVTSAGSQHRPGSAQSNASAASSIRSPVSAGESVESLGTRLPALRSRTNSNNLSLSRSPRTSIDAALGVGVSGSALSLRQSTSK